MKRTSIAVALLLTLQLVSAQEKVAREEALGYAKAASANPKQLNGTPIPTDVDIQQPVAMRDGDYGSMVLPQKGLKAEAIAKATDAPIPVGQLWLHSLTPMKEDRAISEEKLRIATVELEGSQTRVPQCTLAIRRNGEGKLELLVYGAAKEPLLATPLKDIDAKHISPLDMSAQRGDDSGRITLNILGKYEASIQVTELLLF